MTWKNRIIGEGEEAPDQLLANPKNARRHPQNQQQALADVLNEVGVVQRVIVNQRTGYVVDGHARIALALRQGQPTIPVLYVDLDEREEALVLATLDPISAMATYDAAALDELLRDVNTGSAALQTMLDDLATEAGLYLPNDDGPPVDAEPQISRAEELRAKWGTEAGQLWKLGEHRLAVGDCTDAAVVERVMGGERADAVVTDPPYGMRFDPMKERGGPVGGVGKGGKVVPSIPRPAVVGDEDTTTVSRAWQMWRDLASEHVWWGANYYADILPPSSCWLVWDKENTGDFADAELAWSNRKTAVRIFRHMWNGMMKASERGESRLHATQKPVALMAWCIDGLRPESSVVADPFCGSGPVLLACEQLGRRCRAIEIDPGYAAVTLQRWADATGGTPELIDE